MNKNSKSKIEKECDDLFEKIYKYSYNSKFLPKEICRKCFDTACQMGRETDIQVEDRYEDIIELVIDLKIGIKEKIKESIDIEEDTEIWKESKNIVRKIGANK